MADIKFDWKKGLRTSKSIFEVEPGELWVSEGVYYRPDDDDCLWKLPGRKAVTTPSLTATLAPDGIVGMYYPDGVTSVAAAMDYTGLSTSRVIHEIVASTSPTAWTLKYGPNGNVMQCDGSFLKGLPDGLDRWLLFSGNENERAIVRDKSGNLRRIGLQKPGGKPALTAVTLTPTVTRLWDTGAGAWTDESKAYDADTATFSYATINSTALSKVETWSMHSGLTTSSNELQVAFGTSSLPPFGDGGGSTGGGGSYGGGSPGSGSGGTEPILANFLLEYTTDGSIWTTIFNGTNPITKQTAVITLADGIDENQISVRATATYSSGTGSVSFRIYDMCITDQGSGSLSGPIANGTYGYVVSCVYSGPDGVEVESEGSDVTYITIAGGTATGIQLDFSSFGDQNVADDTPISGGYAGSGYFYRVYRTTSTGVYPNLGLVQNIAATTGTWVDPFNFAGTTLGGIPYPTITVGTVQFPANGMPPAFWDAVNYQGAVVAIPADDRNRIKWSLAGQPESWPTTVLDLLMPSADHNDQLCGLTVNANNLILFTRSQTYRLDGLTFPGQANFDPASMTRELLAPNIGLAAGPKGYASCHDAGGRPIVAWISDNGIFGTFGRYVYMMGPVVFKISETMDWGDTVDKSRLDEAKLTYDPEKEHLLFDFWHQDGSRQQVIFHVTQIHWFQFDQNKHVPRATGLHRIGNTSRWLTDQTVTYMGGRWRRWSVSNDGYAWLEAEGLKDEALFFNDRGDILTQLRSGWHYLAGPRGFYHAYTGVIGHDDWGPTEQAEITLELRDNDSGVSSVTKKDGVSLRGARLTRFWLSRAGQSLRFTIQHIGQAHGSFSFLVIDGEGAPGSDTV